MNEFTDIFSDESSILALKNSRIHLLTLLFQAHLLFLIDYNSQLTVSIFPKPQHDSFDYA